MAKKSRTKGATGERELIRVLNDRLGLNLERNLSQTRDGGWDLNGLPDVAIECKRYAQADTGTKHAWWHQAKAQAGRKIPVLAYRLDRQAWKFVLRMQELLRLPCQQAAGYNPDTLIETDLEGFVMWLENCILEIPYDDPVPRAAETGSPAG